MHSKCDYLLGYKNRKNRLCTFSAYYRGGARTLLWHFPPSAYSVKITAIYFQRRTRRSCRFTKPPIIKALSPLLLLSPLAPLNTANHHHVRTETEFCSPTTYPVVYSLPSLLETSHLAGYSISPCNRYQLWSIPIFGFRTSKLSLGFIILQIP